MPDVGGVAGDRLKSLIERIERVEEEIKGLNADKSDIYSEAKSSGYDVKAMKEIVRIRRMDPSERDERETMVDLYKQAIGMLPLFERIEEPQKPIGTPRATRARTSSLEKAAKDFLAPIAKEPGASISVTCGDAGGIRIENRDGEMVAETIPAKAAEPPRSVKEIAATIAATEAPLGSDVTVTLVGAKEEMPAGAILAAGASAAARGEPEDNCPHAGERNRDLWLQGHREMVARKRQAA